MLLSACKRSVGFKSAAKIDRLESLVLRGAALRWLVATRKKVCRGLSDENFDGSWLLPNHVCIRHQGWNKSRSRMRKNYVASRYVLGQLQHVGKGGMCWALDYNAVKKETQKSIRINNST